MPFKVPFLCSPYIAAAFALVAIGVVVYEVLSSRNAPHAYGRPPPPPPPSPPPTPPSSKPKRQRSKTKDRGHDKSRRPQSSRSSDEGGDDSSTSSTQSKDSRHPIGYIQNNVRRRNVNGSKNNGEESPQKTSNLDCQDINKSSYEKNVCEKILNDITRANRETKVNENLNKNIPDEDSDSENNVPGKENAELRIGNVLDHPLSPTYDCNRLSETKEMYRRNVCDTLKKENQEIEEAAVVSESSSHVELNEHINANISLGICSGCEENPVNAEACPCGHRYLCLDCFQRIFRIGYRRCSICYTHITEFRAV